MTQINQECKTVTSCAGKWLGTQPLKLEAWGHNAGMLSQHPHPPTPTHNHRHTHTHPHTTTDIHSYQHTQAIPLGNHSSKSKPLKCKKNIQHRIPQQTSQCSLFQTHTHKRSTSLHKPSTDIRARTDTVQAWLMPTKMGTHLSAFHSALRWGSFPMLRST